VKLGRGTIVWVDLGPTRGHEQRRLRPCVVVSSPDVVAQQRYPLLCVVPLTGTPGEGALYPRLAPGPSGLRKPSFALVDQIRSVDKTRVRRVFEPVALEEMRGIDVGICLYLGLDETMLPAPGP